MTMEPDNESEYAYIFKVMVGTGILVFLLIILIILFNVCVHFYRRRRGVLLSRSLPTFSFSAAMHHSLQECAVCLSEFADGDKVRTLPNCKHGFHTHCIDSWFASHCTCPLCRTPVQPVKGCSDNEPCSITVSEADEGCSSSLGPRERRLM